MTINFSSSLRVFQPFQALLTPGTVTGNLFPVYYLQSSLPVQTMPRQSPLLPFSCTTHLQNMSVECTSMTIRMKFPPFNFTCPINFNTIGGNYYGLSPRRHWEDIEIHFLPPTALITVPQDVSPSLARVLIWTKMTISSIQLSSDPAQRISLTRSEVVSSCDTQKKLMDAQAGKHHLFSSGVVFEVIKED